MKMDEPVAPSGHLAVKKLIWKIENFSHQFVSVGDYLTSPTFLLDGFGNNNDMKWELRLYPNGTTKWNSSYLSVFLHCITSDFDEMKQIKLSEYCSKLSIIDITGDNVNVQTGHLAMPKFQSIIVSQNSYPFWEWKQYIKKSDLLLKKSTLLNRDALTISFFWKEKWRSNTTEDDAPCSLLNQFESLYSSGEFSDVTIVIKDKEIKAHKCILSSRSKVFSAMLKHDMEENNTGIINVDDIDYDVMKEFLLYLYSGTVPNLENSVESLLAIADKYDVEDLKKVCEISLWDNVDDENVCELLRLADFYDCKNLMSRALIYIVKHYQKVLTTKGFDKLAHSDETLMGKILHEVVRVKKI